MEQHPVPQNVTTFQFRLIGDMTIKQFGYLAAGAILAYISYKLPLPFFFSWPLTLIFGLGGIGFAFVPVEDRPMDVWVMSFLKNVYSPTLFVWARESASHPAAPPAPKPAVTAQAPAAQSAPQAAAPPIRAQAPSAATSPKQQRVSNVLAGLFGSVRQSGSTPTPIAPNPATVSHIASAPQSQASKRVGVFDWIADFLTPKPQQAGPARILSSTPNIPSPSVTGRHLDISLPPTVSSQNLKKETEEFKQAQQKEAALETKVSELKKELETKTQTQARILELQKQLTDVLAERNRMEEELVKFRQQSAPQPAPAVLPSVPQPAPSSATTVATPTTQPQTTQTRQGPTVKIITPESAIKAGLPRLTTFPNVVTGIIKDYENNLLPGVLVTVKDRDGMPLRALKTNRLGQFAASTPLSNGTYFVEIEDPRNRYTFDRVQITLNGSIVPAIEVVAKSQKELSRAKLAAELFGTKP